MDISDRKKRILAAVIDEYIQTAEPVGSKKIAQDSGLGLSSATIRNEMAELESMGFLEQPHTSAGRVPSALGYRIYVNEMMQRHKLSVEETEAISATLRNRVQQLDKLITDVGMLVSRLTNYPAYSIAPAAAATISRFDFIHIDDNTFIIVALMSNNTVKNKLVHLPTVTVNQAMLKKLSSLFNASFTGITDSEITDLAISSAERAVSDKYGLVSVVVGFTIEILSNSGMGEAYIAGASTLLRQPEFRDPEKAHRLIEYLSDSEKLLELPAPMGEDKIKFLVSPEEIAEELKGSSVVMARYDVGENMRGLVGVVGPTRMDYSKVSAKLNYIAEGLHRLLGTGAPPGIEPNHTEGDDTQ